VKASEEEAEEAFKKYERQYFPPNVLQGLLRAVNEKIENIKGKDSDQNSKRVKFLKWLQENVVLGTNIRRYGFIAVIIITAILILFAMSKIPVIGKLFKFLLKIIFLPFTLLVKGLTFILKKLGIMSSEEVRQTISQQQKAAIA